MDFGINKSVDDYINLIQKNFDEFEKAYLFGSYAKGKYNRDSDIDLALVFRHLDDSERFDVQVQLILLASQIDSRIEPHPISSSDFNSGNPFIDEIKKTGVELQF